MLGTRVDEISIGISRVYFTWCVHAYVCYWSYQYISSRTYVELYVTLCCVQWILSCLFSLSWQGFNSVSPVATQGRRRQLSPTAGPDVSDARTRLQSTQTYLATVHGDERLRGVATGLGGSSGHFCSYMGFLQDHQQNCSGSVPSRPYIQQTSVTMHSVFSWTRTRYISKPFSVIVEPSLELKCFQLSRDKKRAELSVRACNYELSSV